jgi:hypothetical protein
MPAPGTLAGRATAPPAGGPGGTEVCVTDQVRRDQTDPAPRDPAADTPNDPQGTPPPTTPATDEPATPPATSPATGGPAAAKPATGPSDDPAWAPPDTTTTGGATGGPASGPSGGSTGGPAGGGKPARPVRPVVPVLRKPASGNGTATGDAPGNGAAPGRSGWPYGRQGQPLRQGHPGQPGRAGQPGHPGQFGRAGQPGLGYGPPPPRPPSVRAVPPSWRVMPLPPAGGPPQAGQAGPGGPAGSPYSMAPWRPPQPPGAPHGGPQVNGGGRANGATHANGWPRSGSGSVDPWQRFMGAGRPAYREPFPVRAKAVLAGLGAGALWFLMFGAVSWSARSYAWTELIAGVLATLAAVVLARFGDRGVAVGVTAASGLGLGIAGIVVTAYAFSGTWLFW